MLKIFLTYVEELGNISTVIKFKMALRKIKKQKSMRKTWRNI